MECQLNEAACEHVIVSYPVHISLHLRTQLRPAQRAKQLNLIEGLHRRQKRGWAAAPNRFEVDGREGAMHPEVTQLGSLSEGRIRGSNGWWRQEMMSQLWSTCPNQIPCACSRQVALSPLPWGKRSRSSSQYIAARGPISSESALALSERDNVLSIQPHTNIEVIAQISTHPSIRCLLAQSYLFYVLSDRGIRADAMRIHQTNQI